jgi:hypothetical protein
MRRGSSLPRRRFSSRGEIPKLLDRAEPDSVGLAQGPVDGSGLGNPHFSAADQWRRVGGIGIAVAYKAPRKTALINDGFEDPTTDGEIGELVLYDRLDSTTTSSRGKLQESGVGHIPATLQELQIARSY